MSSPSKPPPKDSRWTTNSVQSFLDSLIATFPDVRERCTDDDTTFSYSATTSSGEEALGWLNALSPHADKCDVKLDCSVDEGFEGRLRVRPRRRLSVDQPFERDPAVFPEPSDPSLLEAIEQLEERSGRRGASIRTQELGDFLEKLSAGGLTLRLELTLSVNKASWSANLLGHDLEANIALYFYPCQFLKQLERKTFEDMEKDWFPARSQPTVLLVLQAQGYLEGDYLACFGLEAREQIAPFLGRQRDFERLASIRRLRDQQCNWDGKPEVLTPDHLYLQDRGFAGDCAKEIKAELDVVAVQLAVGYLADRTDRRADPPVSQFDAPKPSQVPAEREVWRGLIRKDGLDARPCLDLYRWAYENYSADQLSVVRQLIWQKLEGSPEENARELLQDAGKMLETARFNLQQLVRRNIAEYFVARNQVSEFLRKYTDDIAKTISDLTGELVGNLYKTLAAIIGAIVAAGITEEPAVVVLVTAGLYFVYVLFIILYVQPSVWIKFHVKKKEYDNNVDRFVEKDILLQEDVRGFQGKAYQEAERLFYWYFAVTLAIYVGLAAVAFLVAEFYGLRMLLQ